MKVIESIEMHTIYTHDRLISYCNDAKTTEAVFKINNCKADHFKIGVYQKRIVIIHED